MTITTNNNVSEYTTIAESCPLLGIILPEDVKFGVSLITPLAYFKDGGWYTIRQHERHDHFPNNGKVAFFGDYTTSKISQLCCFRIERNLRLTKPDDTRYSHYMLNGELELAPIAQIFNWTARVKQYTDIPSLLDQGIEKNICLSQRIYIRHLNFLYGPIRLDLTSLEDRPIPVEYLQSSNTGGPSLFVSAYQFTANNVLTFDIASDQYYGIDESTLSSPLHQEDWSQPQVIIKRVLQASNELRENLDDNVHLVDKCIRELARLSSQGGPEILQIEKTTLTRAQQIIHRQLENVHGVRTLLETLPAEHPLLQAACKQVMQNQSVAIQHSVEERKKEVENNLSDVEEAVHKAEKKLTDVEEAIHQAECTLADVNATIHQAEQQREQAQKELDTFKHVMQEELNTFSQEMQEQLTMLSQEPVRAVARLQVTSSLLSQLLHHEQAIREIPSRSSTAETHFPLSAPQPALGAESVITWSSHPSVQELQEDFSTLQKNFWVKRATQAGIQSQPLPVCLAALLAGLVPVVSGSLAHTFMRTLAATIAHDRCWSVPVSVSALTPLDLFGTIDMQRYLFLPSPGDLADIVLQAGRHPQDVAIVLLEGIDRVPGMTTSIPLLRQYMTQQQIGTSGLSTIPLNLFHPRTLAADDPYLGLANLRWPSNLLLAVTCDQDMTSLPLPTLCEPWLVHLDVQLASPQRAASPLPLTQVSFAQWQQWQQALHHDFQQATPLQGAWNEQQQMFHRALTRLQPSDDSQSLMQHLWPNQSPEALDSHIEGNR